MNPLETKDNDSESSLVRNDKKQCDQKERRVGGREVLDLEKSWGVKIYIILYKKEDFSLLPLQKESHLIFHIHNL